MSIKDDRVREFQHYLSVKRGNIEGLELGQEIRQLTIEENKRLFLENLPEYYDISLTADSIGLTPNQIRSWMRDDPFFAEEVNSRRSVLAGKVVKVLYEKAVAAAHPSYVRLFLENNVPEYFSPHKQLIQAQLTPEPAIPWTPSLPSPDTVEGEVREITDGNND